jgi:hypothetical protein
MILLNKNPTAITKVPLAQRPPRIEITSTPWLFSALARRIMNLLSRIIFISIILATSVLDTFLL